MHLCQVQMDALHKDVLALTWAGAQKDNRSSEGDYLEIIYTLEKRLERLWLKIKNLIKLRGEKVPSNEVIWEV